MDVAPFHVFHIPIFWVELTCRIVPAHVLCGHLQCAGIEPAMGFGMAVAKTECAFFVVPYGNS